MCSVDFHRGLRSLVLCFPEKQPFDDIILNWQPGYIFKLFFVFLVYKVSSGRNEMTGDEKKNPTTVLWFNCSKSY